MPDTSLPIVCGGTHYFIQHFLFPPPELSLSRSDLSGREEQSDGVPAKRDWHPPCDLPPTPRLDDLPELRRLLETFWTPLPVWPTANTQGISQAGAVNSIQIAASWSDAQLLSLHQLLAALDPDEAQRWHWRDGRKVKRSIERWWEAQAKSAATEVSRPRAVPGDGYNSSKAGRRARFRTLVFWVYEDMEYLKPRLDRRVDRMVQVGHPDTLAQSAGSRLAPENLDRADRAERLVARDCRAARCRDASIRLA